MNYEYTNPLIKTLDYLRSERDRRIKAYNSKYFCDRKTLKNNINTLQKTMICMNNEIILQQIDREMFKNKQK